MAQVKKLEEKNQLTKEGYENLLKELEDRKVRLREEIAEKLQIATEQGDLSENSAYKAALEEKEMNEKKIEDLEKLISESEIITNQSTVGKVGIGDEVELEKKSDKKKVTYKIVGKSEANPKEGLISVDSPVGQSLYEKRVGDEVTVKLPFAEEVYKLLKIK